MSDDQMTAERSEMLRVPFPDAQIGKLPRTTCRACSNARTKVCDQHKKAKCSACGNYMTTAHIDLDFVGHADVTRRLLEVDPCWSWEPFAVDADGLPKVVVSGNMASMWIRLTVCGVTRPGVGTAGAGKDEVLKELVSDALRNAAMRFGVALDLWSRSEWDDDRTDAADPVPSVDPDAAALFEQVRSLPQWAKDQLAGGAWPDGLARTPAGGAWDDPAVRDRIREVLGSLIAPAGQDAAKPDPPDVDGPPGDEMLAEIRARLGELPGPEQESVIEAAKARGYAPHAPPSRAEAVRVLHNVATIAHRLAADDADQDGDTDG